MSDVQVIYRVLREAAGEDQRDGPRFEPGRLVLVLLPSGRWAVGSLSYLWAGESVTGLPPESATPEAAVLEWIHYQDRAKADEIERLTAAQGRLSAAGERARLLVAVGKTEPSGLRVQPDGFECRYCHHSAPHRFDVASKTPAGICEDCSASGACGPPSDCPAHP